MTRGFRRRIDEAQSALLDFLERDTSGYLGVSWGKDSVVVAHLLAQSGIPYPVVWVKIDPLYNPDCDIVRDAFLDAHDIDYHEIEVEWREEQKEAWKQHAEQGRADSLGYSPKESSAVAGFREAARRWGDRHISGVRAEESSVRTLAMKRWGHSTERTCRPIGYWSTKDVFAYLHHHSLPVHPAYAMSRGGLFDRDRIRVDAFGGGRGTASGVIRHEWEGHYYADRIRHIQQLALFE
jgi:phosphoadenosine phosphosulfate reductase